MDTGMEIVEDGNGESVILPKPANTQQPQQPTAEQPKAKKSKKAKSNRINDLQVAQTAVEEWGKPLAFHAGEIWSFTPSCGWEVVTSKLLALCNKIRGGNAKSGAFEVLCTQFATPNMEHVQEASSYWERKGGSWDGEWVPFVVTSDEVVFSNGVLNVRTNKFRQIEKKILFGARITIPFTGSYEGSCPEFEELLDTAIPDQIEREYLQKISSLILQPHVILRGQIVFWGVKHSGKTTMAAAIACAPAGLVGATFITEDRLVKDKFASAPLVNKFANVANDSGFTKKWEDFMKSYTSGTVVVEPKFHKPVSLPTTAKMISTCNEMQKLNDLSGAAEQRYKVFQFRNPIEETGETSQTAMMTPTYWCDPVRRAGVIAWLLRGLRSAILEGVYEPESLKANKRAAIGASNPLYTWVSECFELAPGEFLSSKDIMDAVPMEETGQVTTQSVMPMVERIWGIPKARIKGIRGFNGLALKD